MSHSRWQRGDGGSSAVDANEQVDSAADAAPDEGVLDPDEGVLDPDEGVLDPDEGVVAPDEGVVAPDEGVVAPDEGVVAPDEGVVAPDEGVVAPDEGVVAPDEGVDQDQGVEPDVGQDEGIPAPDQAVPPPDLGAADQDLPPPDQGAVEPDAAVVEADAAPNESPTVELVAPADGATFLDHHDVGFELVVDDDADAPETLVVVVSSSLDGALAVEGPTPAGVVFGDVRLSVGEHEVTVSVTDSEGSTTELRLTVTVEDDLPPTVLFVAPEVDDVLVAGDDIEIAVDVGDDRDGLDTLVVSLSSDLAGDLETVGPDLAGRVTASVDLGSGEHTLTASVTDSAGQETMAMRVAVVVDNEPPSLAVEAPDEAASFPFGEAFALVARVADDLDGPLAVTVTMTSSIDGALEVAGPDPAGVATAAGGGLGVGEHAITVVATDRRGARTEVIRNVTITRAMAAVAVVVAPAEPTTLMALSASVVDPPEGVLTWMWFRDNADAEIELGQVLAADTARGQTWRAEARIVSATTVYSGSAEVTVANSTPTVDSVAILEAELTPCSQTVTCAVTTSDADGDERETSVEFLVGGAVVAVAGETYTPGGDNPALVVGEMIGCRAAVGDGDADSEPRESAKVAIVAGGDADGDGVCDGDDLCTGDDDRGDTDGDGICDDLDLCFGDNDTGDADQDGLCQDTEEDPGAAGYTNTDDGVFDTDGDLLGDGEEVLVHGTDPADEDTDAGGTRDGDEVAVGTDPTDVADDSPVRRMFVTSGNYGADFGGLGLADEACTTEAAAAGYSTRFQAYLGTTFVGPAERLDDAAYVMSDGTVLAADLDGLLDGALAAAPGIQLDGTARADDLRVWTASNGLGVYDSHGGARSDCEGWTSNNDALETNIGNFGQAGGNWAKNGRRDCGSTLPLYCFEIADGDGDNLSDATEATFGGEADDSDTDGDGLEDGEEAWIHRTDPADSDSDDDLLEDGEEVEDYLTDPTAIDSDGGGTRDGDEVAMSTDPLAAGDDLEARRVFVTSSKQNAALGGLEGADDICNARATEAGLDGAGDFVAFLSQDAPRIDAADRINDATYVTTNLGVVADDLADLTNGGLDTAIRFDEDGDRIPNNLATWTGTRSNGTFDDANTDCEGWTSSAGELAATVGNAGVTGASWVDNAGQTCDSASLRLYCFEVVAPEPAPFFSEYGEGSGSNKWLEIYNPASVAITINDYSLLRCSNGCVNGPAALEFPGDGAVVEAGDVWVVANSSAEAAILAVADQTTGSVSHNGDDGWALLDADGNTIDVVGEFADPGDGWTVGGVANGTKNHTLVRACSVSAGNTDWEDAAATEWEVLDEDDFSDLGSHTDTCE